MSAGILNFFSCLSLEGLCAGCSPCQWLQTKKEFQGWTWSEHCFKSTFAFQKMKQRRDLQARAQANELHVKENKVLAGVCVER